MLFPNFHPKRPPNRWMATLDHLAPRNTDGKARYRPRKAAHRGCNTVRHHDEVMHERVVAYVKGVHEKFDKPSFVKGVFGADLPTRGEVK
jgi:hypothetical protein